MEKIVILTSEIMFPNCNQLIFMNEVDRNQKTACTIIIAEKIDSRNILLLHEWSLYKY